MKILITGALGHIGSKFIHAISPNEFEEVRIVDNLSTQRYASLFRLPNNAAFSFHECDIRDDRFDSLVRGIDAVIHLAAITDAESSINNPDIVFDTNLKGAMHVAETCLSHNVKLLFPSTTSVYGSQADIVSEDCLRNELIPQSPYAESKLMAEEFLLEKSQKEGLNVVIYRMGTIFGTSVGMRFHTAVNKFCWQSVFGQSLTVWRTAINQKRPYLGINDAIEAIRLFLKKDSFDHLIYNVVSNNYALAEIIEHITTRNPKTNIGLVDSPIMNQLSYEVSNQLFINEGFQFKDNIFQGINDTMSMLGR